MKPSDEIETCIHSVVVDAYSRRVSSQNFDHLLQDGELRSRFLVETLVELLGPYGKEWTDSDVTYKSANASSCPSSQVEERLRSISQRSQFLSLHLFDPLDNKRRSIASVFSSDFLALGSTSASALKLRYQAIEQRYIRLSTDTRRPVPTLVNWLRQTVNRGPAKYLAFQLNHSPLRSGWPFVEFPLDQCEELFHRDSTLKRWSDTIDIQSLEVGPVARSIIRASALAHFPTFVETFEKATGLGLEEKNSAEMMLSFYLWQRGDSALPDGFTIMPYYFRGIAWNLPTFNRTLVEVESEHAFLAISCSARKDGLNDEDLGMLDSLARGIASALAICGMEMARDSLRIVFLPYMLRHEVGNRLGAASSCLNNVRNDETDMRAETRQVITDLAVELRDIQALTSEIADFPDPRKLLPDVIVQEQVSDFWKQLFSRMLVTQHPPMDRVSLVIGRARVRIPLGRQTGSDLKNVKWPARALISITHLRQILAKLVDNSLIHAKAQQIEIRLDTIRAPANYIALTVWDDGTEYRESQDKERVHFGHAIISRIIESAKVTYPLVAFVRPPDGTAGKKKIFRLVLPVQQNLRRGEKTLDETIQDPLY